MDHHRLSYPCDRWALSGHDPAGILSLASVAVLMKMKTCGICRKKKSLARFHNSNTHKDKHQPVCKGCSYLEGLYNQIRRTGNYDSESDRHLAMLHRMVRLSSGMTTREAIREELGIDG